jgi:glycosyltransferase involved in cell wall biosynthesis
MDVLLIHRFYHPDSPPYASILEGIRDMLVTEGKVVDVLSSQPSYKSVDQLNKLALKTEDQFGCIYRLPVFRFSKKKIVKGLNFFWFPFIVFWFVLFGKKYKAVTVSTAPPVLLAFSVALACKIRGITLIYHCMDLHPEIGQISGEFKALFIFNLLRKMDEFTCNVAKKIIVLSEDMRQNLLKRERSLDGKIEIINNYNLGGKVLGEHSFFDPNDGKVRVVFAGNLGRFQNLDSLLTALGKSTVQKNLELVFVGEGAALNKLQDLTKKLHLEKLVRFIPHQSVEVAKRIIQDASMAVVSLQNEIIGYAYPSKTMTYLSLGTPILTLVESHSELAEMVTKNKLGIVVEPNDLDALSNCFIELDQGAHTFNKSHIQRFFQNNLSKEQFEAKFMRLMNSVI